MQIKPAHVGGGGSGCVGVGGDAACSSVTNEKQASSEANHKFMAAVSEAELQLNL